MGNNALLDAKPGHHDYVITSKGVLGTDCEIHVAPNSDTLEDSIWRLKALRTDVQNTPILPMRKA